MHRPLAQTQLLGNPQIREQRLAAINQPHIVPLTKFVKQIRTECGLSDGDLPNFDPADAGQTARVLLVLETPGPKAHASGFVSRDNPDPTANNIRVLTAEARLARIDTVIWNIVPWYIGGESGSNNPTAQQVREGLPYLQRLIDLLPALEVCVFCGRSAQRGGASLGLNPRIISLECPHPSNLGLMRNGSRELFVNTMVAAADKCG